MLTSFASFCNNSEYKQGLFVYFLFWPLLHIDALVSFQVIQNNNINILVRKVIE